MSRIIQRSFLLVGYCISSIVLFGQGNVGINNPTPHASALLDLTSSNKGLLMPRMNTAQRTAIAAPATGLLVFDTTLNSFYYFDGTVWLPISSGGAGWGTTGNAGTSVAAHFVGTTDNVPFSFRVNNTPAGRIDHEKENVSLGLRAGSALTSGVRNVAVGDSAGAAMNTGHDNTMVGDNSGRGIVDGRWNTLVGAKAGEGITSGYSNVYVGYTAGALSTTTQGNTAIGMAAGYAGASGGASTFVGSYAGYSATTGMWNTMLGSGAGFNTTTGNYNTFVGTGSGLSNQNGNQNVIVGTYAGQFNQIGNDNTLLGYLAGRNTQTNNNTFIGSFSGWQNLTGVDNTFIGQGSGAANNASKNTFIGAATGAANTSGTDNTFVGTAAGLTNNTGSQNTFLGRSAGRLNAGGSSNTMLGWQAGMNTNSGANNVFVGNNAGSANTSGTQNTYLGVSAGGTAGLTKATAIGYNAQVTANNSLVLGGTGADAVDVGIGTTAPQAELEVNGYTMLGSNAPKVKMLKLTGTTAAAQGSFVSVAHGLTASKILSVEVLVESTAGVNWIPHSFTYSPGLEYKYILTGTVVGVYNIAGNSANILSKPFKILITYEQ
ncbi:MAG: hypothetical protein IPL52_09470 [Flavobacteriales bacterium]|nr:hypothetical protein [Flavobacteriales bacterium]